MLAFLENLNVFAFFVGKLVAVVATTLAEKGGVTPGGKLHLWLSSFERTRATAGWLHTQVRDLVHSIHDNALLVEQDFGLFEVSPLITLAFTMSLSSAQPLCPSLNLPLPPLWNREWDSLEQQICFL